MKTLLCAIGRAEHPYLLEFVEWYKNLGFTNIALYDNNYDGENDFRELLANHMNSGFVIWKDYRNKTICQTEAYESCYMEYGGIYDWIAFFDCDEFLTLAKESSIDEYLSSSKFNGYNAILVNWMCYGDNELLYNDGRPLIERFPKPLPFNSRSVNPWPDNYNVKTILRGGRDIIHFSMPHIADAEPACNASGIRVYLRRPFHKADFRCAYLRHYLTKTITEYCQKIRRGYPDQVFDYKMRAYERFDIFFKLNEATPQKCKIVLDLTGIVYPDPNKPKPTIVQKYYFNIRRFLKRGLWRWAGEGPMHMLFRRLRQKCMK